jgi:hypothetical protein
VIQVLADFLLFLFLLVLIPLGVVGAMVLLAPGETERQRLARESREAERRITEIGRHAQAVILGEALRRAQAKPRATRVDGDPPRTPMTTSMVRGTTERARIGSSSHEALA